MRAYEDEYQLFRNRFQAEQGNNSRSKVAIRILSDAKSVFDITPEQYDQIAHAIKLSNGTDNSSSYYNNMLKTVLRPCSSLCAAAMNDRSDIVRHLLRIGRDPNSERDRHGNTALMLAVAKGHVNVVKAFLELNLDIKVTNNYGETIFDVIPENATEIRNLLEKRQKLLSGHQEMLGILKKDDYDTSKTTLKSYLSNGGTVGSSSLNQNRQTFLHIAASQNAVSSVKALLDSGANPSQQDNDGKTALHIAVEKGNLAAVRALLMQSDLSLKDKWGKTVMALNPAGKDRNEIMSLLQTRSQQVDLKNGLSGEERFFKTLTEARDQGWSENTIKVILNDFIKSGGNVNAKNSNGDTALHIFAGFNKGDYREVVKMLIASGADSRITNAENKTPAMVASTVVWKHGRGVGNVHAILQAAEKRALASGADTVPNVEVFLKELQDAWDNNGSFIVLQHIIRLYVNAGGDINSQNFEGETALHVVAKFNEEDGHMAIQYLLKKGANVFLKNNNEETALVIAEKALSNSTEKDTHAVDLLRNTETSIMESLLNARKMTFQSSPAPNSSATSSIANDPVNRDEKERPGPKWVKAQPKIDYRNFIKEIVNRTEMNKDTKIRAINAEIKKITEIKHTKPEMKKFCDAGIHALREALAVVNKQGNQPSSPRKTGPA